jgi:predicted RNA-binding Zn ribbon-like protein
VKKTLKTIETFENAEFVIVGNNLCLDFINTEIVENNEPKDLIKKPEDFIAWAAATKLIGMAQAETLIKNLLNSESDKFFLRIKKFRMILRECAVRLTQGRKIKTTAIKLINDELRENTVFPEISPTAKGFEKIFRADFNEPLQLLSPVAESAADLLCYGNPAYVKKCENPACVLYFYDISKNHKRRWCSMSSCGNRAKASAFYYRNKKEN